MPIILANSLLLPNFPGTSLISINPNLELNFNQTCQLLGPEICFQQNYPVFQSIKILAINLDKQTLMKLTLVIIPALALASDTKFHENRGFFSVFIIRRKERRGAKKRSSSIFTVSLQTSLKEAFKESI